MGRRGEGEGVPEPVEKGIGQASGIHPRGRCGPIRSSMSTGAIEDMSQKGWGTAGYRAVWSDKKAVSVLTTQNGTLLFKATHL